MASETIFVRGEGGSIFELSLPLSESISDGLAKGSIRRVANADGDPYDGDDDLVPSPPTEVPAKSAVKSEWVAWAVVQGVSLDDAEAATKQDLVDRFGN